MPSVASHRLGDEQHTPARPIAADGDTLATGKAKGGGGGGGGKGGFKAATARIYVGKSKGGSSERKQSASVVARAKLAKGSGRGGGGRGAGKVTPTADPIYAAKLERLGYRNDSFTDKTTEHVLGLVPEDGQPPANLSAWELLKCPNATALAASSTCSFGASSKLEPLLLVIHMPWFLVHTGHIRTWTMLHVFKYPCLFQLLAMRMLVLVQPGELAGCQRICSAARDVCTCRVAEHDRAFQHRNLLEVADGTESILYAHADTWMNLPRIRALLQKQGNHTISPRRGLQGTSYTPTASKCIPPCGLCWRIRIGA